MKFRIIIYFLFPFTLACSSTKTLDKSNHRNIHVKYIEKKLTSEKITESTSFFKSMNKNGDTLIANNTLKGLDKFANFISKSSSHYDYYFFKDSIRVNNPFSSYIYIPDTREKFSSEIYPNGKRKFESKKIFKEYKTTEAIQILKGNKKRINGIKCYLIEIKKTQKIGKSERIKTFSVYLSNKFNIPLNDYDLLNLSNQTDLSGLVMELTIRNEFGHILNHYVVSEINTDQLNHVLIDINTLKNL